MFGKKKKLVLWVKTASVEVYSQKTKNNFISIDCNLYKEGIDFELSTLKEYLLKEKLESITVLLGEDTVVTKSFVYDAKTDNIDKEEVVKLAHSSVNFELDSENVEFYLLKTPNKTIIRCELYNKSKFSILRANLAKLALTVRVFYLPLSSTLAKAISNFYQEEYFLLYPTDKSEYTLLLAKNDLVYLSNKLKGVNPDLQKIINYSNLYFDKTIERLFFPKDLPLEYKANEKLEKADFIESQLAQNLKYPENLPLPVLGAFMSGEKSAKISHMNIATMPDKPTTPATAKKSPLPLIIVFSLTAIIVSTIVYFALNRGSSETPTPVANISTSPSPSVEATIPTEKPTPTLPEVNKKLKIQILNATDINGQAAKVKSALMELGFKDITTGNSKEKITQNEIRTKKKLSELESYFSTAMADSFPATFSAKLSDTGSFDVVMIIGTDLSKSTSTKMDTTSPTEEPTAEPTAEETLAP